MKMPLAARAGWRLATAACLLAGAAAWATPYDDGLAALQRADYPGAFNAFRQSATRGDADAQFQLSLLYASGRGVVPDAKAALMWLRESALRGNLQARSNLGVAYNRGRGVPQDGVKAYAWFTLAAASGDRVALTNRDTVARTLRAEQLAQAQALAITCQRNASACL